MGAPDQEKFGHELRVDRKTSGATYTPIRIAAAVARKLLEAPIQDTCVAASIRILDPGCGDGSLTFALLSEMSVAQRNVCQVVCLDIDEEALNLSKMRLQEEFPQVSFTFTCGDFIDYAIESHAKGTLFDIIIANPPYVRIQSLKPSVRDRIKVAFGLAGRTDLSFAFIIAMTQLLRPGGRAAVIASNKVLSTAAGRPVREALLAKTKVTCVWDLGDTKLFDAAVLPTVIYFCIPQSEVDGGSSEATFTAIYQILAPDLDACHEDVADLCDQLEKSMIKRTSDGRMFAQVVGALQTDGTWRARLDTTQDWSNRVAAATWKRFEDVGKVSVGIKTTADKVFIAKDWLDPVPELLKPLVTHHVAARYRPASKPVRDVLYPHEMVGGKKSAVDISQHPHAQAYLESHRERLEGRSYVIEAGREWFELWVPHSPDDWDATKIVFRDISEQPTFWIENDGAVINGDCYWIKLAPSVDPDLIWLMLAVGNSKLIEKFYDVTFNERLYAGRRRFMTRHVKQFPIPDPVLPASKEAASLARKLYGEEMSSEQRADLERKVDVCIDAAFGITS